MGVIRNQAGQVIAWISTDTSSENEDCQAAIDAGRPVHITPAPSDPRAAGYTLALPTYNYATEVEAVLALELAWATAETVFTVAERDAAYARGVPVKISRDGTWT